MKKLLLLLTICPFFSFAQVADKEEELRKSLIADTSNGWKRGAVINVNFTQTSFSNWAAGGENTFAFNEIATFFTHYKGNRGLWENYLDVGYGLSKRSGRNKWTKTDDKLEFTSKYGQKAFKKVYYAALVNMKTQMVNGYNQPNDSIKISGFFSPAYLIGAIGLDNKPSETFSIFIAPVTTKVTYVKDDVLANAGAFGVEKGKHSRTEFGGYARIFLKKEIMANTTLQTKVDLFSNYFKKALNIDVNAEALLSMKVNKWISTSVFVQTIYDDDVKIVVDKNNDAIPEAVGPRLQFKEIFGLGINYAF